MIFDILIWIGAALSVLGLLGLGWCIIKVMRAKRSGLDDEEMRDVLARVVPLNMGALLLSDLGNGSSWHPLTLDAAVLYPFAEDAGGVSLLVRLVLQAADDSVTGNKTVRDMEARIRELERQLGRKTMEVEILKEALDKSRAKKPTLLAQSLKRDDLP